MNKIKKILKSLWYGLPFGLKGADTEIMGSKSLDGDGVTIGQEVSDERVAKHLLKGEVTQEVEELRYRTYKVSEEADKYKYLGNGIAIKQEEKQVNNIKTKYRFTQENENICESVLQSLNQVGKYGIEKYRFEIEYNSMVRFKVEKFATKVDVNIDDENGIIETVLHFNTEPNPYDSTSKPFINEISKLMTATTKYEIDRNEIASSIMSFSFTTYKANNEDDFVTYSFTHGGKFEKFEQKGYEYLMTLSWDEYTRIPMDLSVKYYSKSMAEKYKNKERKNVVISVNDSERKAYCSVCGKEMSVYDADIQRVDGQEPICKECMQKAFK